VATTLTQLRAGGAAAEGDEFSRLLRQPLQVFSPDAYHVMQQRDDQLIKDELLRGDTSKAFVYRFPIQGNEVTGVSVIGARQLASEYGGIKARIVATVEKRGALFIFRSFEPLNIETRTMHDLADEIDYYECIMQVDDIKTGNAIQVRKKEAKLERKKSGDMFERPHYDVICESKAYRNGVLSVLPQAVIQAFKAKHLAAGNTSNEKTMEQLREGAKAFAAKHGISLVREVLSQMAYSELYGFGSAAAQGPDAFMQAGVALGVIVDDGHPSGEVPPPPPAAPKPTATPAQTPPPPPAAAKREDPIAKATAKQQSSEWEPTPAELEEIHARELAEAEAERKKLEAAAATPAQQEPARARRGRTMPDVP